MKDWFKNYVWLVILAASLGTSGWSLFYVARHLGAPVIISAVISTTLDGVALLSADYALKYARSGDSGLGPRLAVYVFAALSAYLNSEHAAITHEMSFARILWAVPAVSAVLVYEFHTRWERRAALTRAGKSLPPLPTIGVMSWILFPFETLRQMRTLIRYRRERILARYAPGSVIRFKTIQTQSLGQSPETTDPIEESFRPEIETETNISAIPTAEIREWAKARGIGIGNRGSLPASVVEEFYREKGA